MTGTDSLRLEAEPALDWRRRWFSEGGREVQLTRFVLLRGIGFIYLVAFAILVQQGLPLLGSRGLMPVRVFLARVREQSPSLASAVWNVPSLFWLGCSDRWLLALAWLGLLLE